MGPLCVIGFSPCLDLLLGMGQIQEPVFIEAFITEVPDEALGRGVIRRPSGPYVLNAGKILFENGRQTGLKI
jgi:hypothetical protein